MIGNNSMVKLSRCSKWWNQIWPIQIFKQIVSTTTDICKSCRTSLEAIRCSLVTSNGQQHSKTIWMHMLMSLHNRLDTQVVAIWMMWWARTTNISAHRTYDLELRFWTLVVVNLIVSLNQAEVSERRSWRNLVMLSLKTPSSTATAKAIRKKVKWVESCSIRCMVAKERAIMFKIWELKWVMTAKYELWTINWYV